jgi:AraC-like DNA-binding protein
VVPASDLFRVDDRPCAEQVLATHGLPDMVEVLESYLSALRPEPDPVVDEVRALVDAAAAAHSGVPVDWAGLAADLGFTDQAHLTRAFTSVVGTPPATYQRTA